MSTEATVHIDYRNVCTPSRNKASQVTVELGLAIVEYMIQPDPERRRSDIGTLVSENLPATPTAKILVAWLENRQENNGCQQALPSTISKLCAGLPG